MLWSVIFNKVKNTASFRDAERGKGQNTVMSPSNNKQVQQKSKNKSKTQGKVLENTKRQGKHNRQHTENTMNGERWDPWISRQKEGNVNITQVTLIREGQTIIVE